MMKRVLTSILRVLLVILFLYYYVGNTAFIHTHTFRNNTVTHSHPFLPGAHHTHAGGAEMETIALFNAFIAVATPALMVVFGMAFLGFILQVYPIVSFVRKLFSLSLRAPPTV